LRHLDHAALLDHRIVVEPALGDVHFGVAPEFRRPRADAPGRGPRVGRLPHRYRGRKLHPAHPVGKRQIEPDGSRVMLQGGLQLSHLVVALAEHRMVADRVDPPALRGLDRALPGVLEMVQCVLVFAFRQQPNACVVSNRRDAPLPELGRNRPREEKQGRANPEQRDRGDAGEGGSNTTEGSGRGHPMAPRPLGLGDKSCERGNAIVMRACQMPRRHHEHVPRYYYITAVRCQSADGPTTFRPTGCMGRLCRFSRTRCKRHCPASPATPLERMHSLTTHRDNAYNCLHGR
jgi:hypothetical protein